MLPLVPTIPFMLLAAFCFARSSRRMEQKLLDHPIVGPHILSWRTRRAISRKGKIAAIGAFVGSAIVGLATLSLPWSLIPLTAALIGGSWIWTRPE